MLTGLMLPLKSLVISDKRGPFKVGEHPERQHVLSCLKGTEKGTEISSPWVAEAQEQGAPSRYPIQVAGAQGLEPSHAVSQGVH